MNRRYIAIPGIAVLLSILSTFSFVGGHNESTLVVAARLHAAPAAQSDFLSDVYIPYIMSESDSDPIPDGGGPILDGGDSHTCALTGDGGVKCWGFNAHGQLGDGSTEDNLASVDVVGLTSGVQAIATGSFHTCALTDAGGVKCWGSNLYGQMGDGTSGVETNKITPVDVIGLASGVQAITGGGSHTCALTGDGGVKCWGWNQWGQVGDGSTEDRSTPVDVVGLASGVQAIAGNGYTCALTDAGGVKCWGWNTVGQLGDGTSGLGTDKYTPVDVVGLASGVQAIAVASAHACALMDAGGVKCWGSNHDGQVGDGSSGGDAHKSTPVDVVGLASGVQAIAAGQGHTCALTGTGGVKCWGSNTYGQLGERLGRDRSTPVDVFELTSGVRSIATGSHHTCALMSAGGAKCWGRNGSGRLGDGTTEQRTIPVDVVVLTE